MKALLTLGLCVLFCLLLTPFAFPVDVPHLISYQGKLTHADGSPIDTTVAISFQLYDAEVLGNYLWKESHLDVVVTNGLFNILLGSFDPLTPEILDGRPLWLAIAVGTEPKMEQRVPVVSSAYAIRAEDADFANQSVYADTAGYVVGSVTSGWNLNGNVVHLADDADSVGIGTATPAAKLHVNGNLRLAVNSDLEFGSHLTRLNASGGDLFIEAEDDLWFEPTDRIYIRSASTSSWMLIDPINEEVGIGTTYPEELLEIEEDSDGGRAFLQIESSHPSNWGEAGLRIKTPQNTWHLRMDDDTNNNIPEGALGLRSQVGVEAMTWAEDGKVGIGTTNPQEKLHVAGNLQVDGDVIADNIMPAPGVASNYVQSVIISLSSGWQSLVSRQITVPGPGYVIAYGSCAVYMDHDISGSTSVHSGLSTSATGPPTGYRCNMLLGSNVAAGRYSMPASAQAVFTVATGGSYTYYYIAESAGDNPASVFDAQITLLYVPTNYGTVKP